MANHLSNGANEYAVGKVYGLVEKISNLNFIPAQRKSDNKCGLFETKNGVFYPMGGTTTLTAAAGPTVREYVPYLVDVVKINQPSGRII